ncbi:MAG TPA: MinD/ParA family protein [Gammaproteobacteria bacterium]|nr:MinD/ParA family protein [Gammaproteobacteria bacterium]
MNKILNMPPSSPSEAPQADLGELTRVIAITSGKGGVGKTNVTSNLAIELAARGARVCIFDADTSLANINVLMGLTPQYTIEDLLSGDKTIDDIILDGPKGIKIVPAASGIAECVDLDAHQQQALVSALAELEKRFDYILIDTAAGIGNDVLSFIKSAQSAIVVISPEPTSLTDAFALIRVLKRQRYEQPIYVLVNMVMNYTNSMDVFNRFEAATQKYLHVKVHYLGYIPDDANIKESVASQTPVTLRNPDSLASRCFGTLAEVLGKQLQDDATPSGFSRFWREKISGGHAQETEEKQEARPEPASTPDAGEAQEAATSPTPPESLPIDGRRIEAWLEEQQPTREQAREVFLSFLDAYARQFDESLLDPQALTRYFAEHEKLSEPALRDVIFALEALFEKRFKHPLRSLESRIMKLVADIDSDQALIGELIRQLKESCGEQLCNEMLRSPTEFHRAVRDSDLDEESLAYLMDGIRSVYEERYGTAPANESDVELEHIRAMVKRLDQQEALLDSSLAELHRYIERYLKEPPSP